MNFNFYANGRPVFSSRIDGSSLEAADLETREADARTNLDAALEARDAARDAALGAQASLREAEQVGDAATMHAREIEAAEVLAADVVEYVQTKVMTAALERLLAAEEPDHDTALLTHASTLARRLTGGRVAGLTVEERAGEHRLRIEADGLGEGIPGELSQGTADQVYLALRLAGIRQRPNAPPRSRSGTSTTTTIDPTPPSATSPRPHASTQASPTS